MLFKVSEESGIKLKTTECKSHGDIEPWWDVSKRGGLCESRLKEGIYCYLEFIDRTHFKVTNRFLY